VHYHLNECLGIMLRNQDLNLLPIFDALIREQQLSRAAEKLSMSQPAVSNALKRLRLSFKDDLFVRTGRGLQPTQRALELHSMISPALGMIRQGFDDQDFEPMTFDRAIDISMNVAAEPIWLPSLMEELRAHAPNLVLQVHPAHLSDIPGRLKDGRLSYALEYLPLPPDHFDSKLVIQEDLMVICSATHPVLKDRITLQQFETLPQVSLVPRSSLIPQQNSRRGTPIEQILGRDLPPRNVLCHVSSFSAIPTIVAVTDLIAVVPGRLAQPLIDTGQLRSFDVPFPCPKLTIRLYWHKSRSSDPSHAWFIQQIENSAKNL
jgi:DNA-binding transcriptional LysR family regulator